MINQDLQIKQILEQSKTIAILGLSPSEDKPSHKVAKYLLEKGYRIIPIYPKGGEILGMKVYRSLQEVFCDESIRQSGGVDILDIFRKSEALLGIIQEISGLENKPKCVWAQLGIQRQGAKEELETKGIMYFENLCIKLEHQRLCK